VLVTFILVIPLAVMAVGVASGFVMPQERLVVQLLPPEAIVQPEPVRVPDMGALTLTSTKSLIDNPLPEFVQVTVKRVFAERGPVDTEPLVAPPVEKFVPAQEVALVDVQFSVAEVPDGIVIGP